MPSKSPFEEHLIITTMRDRCEQLVATAAGEVQP
jgi:hypothetical protein